MINILFLSSNPDGTTQLDLMEEYNAIEDELDMTRYRDSFDLNMRFELKPSEIAFQLLKHKPVIVHFSGHGNRAGEIILENEKTGKPQAVDVEAIEGLFSTLKDNIRCVVLNACFTQLQAKLISRHIDCVIGMRSSIGDAAAIEFAKGFYLGLGMGKDIETAFKLACVQIHVNDLKDQDKPKIIWKNDVHQKIVLVSSGEVTPIVEEELELDNSTYNEIVNLLCKVQFSSQQQRTALMNSAFHGCNSLLDQIAMTGNPNTFANNLIPFLKDYGEIKRGKHRKQALVVLLEAMSSQVGIKDQEKITRIIKSLSQIKQ